MGSRSVNAEFSWEEFSSPTPFDRRAPDAAWVHAQFAQASIRYPVATRIASGILHLRSDVIRGTVAEQSAGCSPQGSGARTSDTFPNGPTHLLNRCQQEGRRVHGLVDQDMDCREGSFSMAQPERQ